MSAEVLLPGLLYWASIFCDYFISALTVFTLKFLLLVFPESLISLQALSQVLVGLFHSYVKNLLLLINDQILYQLK